MRWEEELHLNDTLCGFKFFFTVYAVFGIAPNQQK